MTIVVSYKLFSNKLLLPSMNNLNYQTMAAQQCKLHVNIEIYTNRVLFKPISRDRYSNIVAF